MAFLITTLIENTTPTDSLAAEHGLSMLVEGNGYRILYDTGPSPRFLMNAKALSIDLDQLDAVVLSHGHYDHTGGTAALLARSEKPKGIYLGTGFFRERYTKKPGGLLEISAAVEEIAITNSGVPCYEVGTEPLSLGKGIWLLSGFVSTDKMEPVSTVALRRTDGQLEPDPFDDEVAMILETANGLAMLSGCAHVGILSMCHRVKEIFGQEVTTFLGGTHLFNADDARIQHTCDCLKRQGMTRLGACHCSGERAKAYFSKNLPGFFDNTTGSKVILE